MHTVMDSFEEYVAVGDVSLWTVREGNGPPVLLCHGGPGACDNLAPVAEMLRDIAAVHRYDQRGCGRSAYGASCTIATSITDIEALREHWGYERWIILGHSWGTQLALAYAMEHPTRVKGLLLLASAGIDPIDGRYRENYRKRLLPEDLARLDALDQKRRDAWGEEVAAIREEMLRIRLKADLADPAGAIDIPRYRCRMNFALNAMLAAEWGELARQPDIERRIAGLRMPVLIVNGEDDPRPIDGAERLARMLPEADLVKLPGVGHYPWLERPELLRDAIRSFIAPSLSSPR